MLQFFGTSLLLQSSFVSEDWPVTIYIDNPVCTANYWTLFIHPWMNVFKARRLSISLFPRPTATMSYSNLCFKLKLLFPLLTAPCFSLSVFFYDASEIEVHLLRHLAQIGCDQEKSSSRASGTFIVVTCFCFCYNLTHCSGDYKHFFKSKPAK